ncbi:MAG: ferric reductase-like transmembrane domain-containing protein [Candidatus Nanopelagicales bacterium]
MNALWFATRSTGLMTLVLLTAVTVLGILTAGGWVHRHWPRLVTSGLHRNLSLLTVLFLGTHIATTVVDGYAPVGWLDAVVPFASPYKTLWLGLGAVAVDLVIALVATSLIRSRLPVRAWRGLHWTAYGAFGLAVLHGLGAGTDTGLDLALSLACLLAVAGTAAVRFGLTRTETYA